jgi:hypothetical protein
MTTSDSFPYLIGNILGDLEVASQIRIDCTTAEENNVSQLYAPIRVVAVNGMDSARQFMNLLRHLKAEALGQFREVIPHIAPADLDNFIDQALRRVRRITRSVTINGPGGEETFIGQDACWSILQLICFLEDVEADDPLIYLEAMVQTRRQAWIYHLELKRLEERISCLAGGTIVMPFMNSMEQEAKSKIRLNCSVAFLGALLRVACDRNLIECANVAELCRWASENFSTVRQENLSPRSLRKHFDNPLPKALEQVMQEIHVWERYIPKFIEQQQR